jgi:uncharacterized coiled-coil DUF342 family protein
MDDYKCLTCLILKEKLDLIDLKMEELKKCNEKIKEYNYKQINLIEEIQELVSEYKKLKNHCSD